MEKPSTTQIAGKTFEGASPSDGIGAKDVRVP
jgi:hypothetical protein